MKKYRIYADPEKEALFLNKMSDKGYRFVSYFLGLYHFVPCEAGKYVYKIDLLDDMSEFDDYSDFMAEQEINVPDRWFRWVYLEKVKTDIPFEIYTDNASKHAFYEKQLKMYLFAGIADFVIALMEIVFLNVTQNGTFVFFAAFLIILGIALLSMYVKSYALAEKYKY